MAGKKGCSGGARPGAGAKRKPPVLLPPIAELVDPKAFLLAVMNDPGADAHLRMDAAKALLPYEHQKLGESGKKEGKQSAAAKVAAGKFAPASPPKLATITRLPGK